MMHVRTTALGFFAALQITLSAQAAPIVFDFAATVTQEFESIGVIAFEAATGLDATAFDLGDVFTGQVAIDLSRAGVDTASETSANPSGGLPPLLPPFLEISISDGVNSASPLTVPFASAGTDADQEVVIFSDTLSLFQDVDTPAFSEFGVFMEFDGVAGLSVLDDLVSGGDFSNASNLFSSFDFFIEGGGSFARAFDVTSFELAPSGSPVPVPATASLLLAGLGGIATFRRRRRREFTAAV
ncbi:MAG: VPLPA-CTERM sorting domain-containing protein [Pseudomonadota bacterium]